MNLTLTDEQREIREWVRTFVRKELLPLEPEVLKRERAHEPTYAPGEYAALQAKAAGFFGIQTPPEYGGMGLDAVTSALIETELGYTFVPFRFAGEADNILFEATEEQKQRYLLPTISDHPAVGLIQVSRLDQPGHAGHGGGTAQRRAGSAQERRQVDQPSPALCTSTAAARAAMSAAPGGIHHHHQPAAVDADS